MPNTPKLVTRANTTSTNTVENLGKGSKLTFAEMDSNFIELKNGSIGVVADDSATIDVKHGDTLYIQGGTNVTTSTDSSGVITINATGEVTADSTTTFTNKTFDANATGNSITNLEVADFAGASIVTESEGISSNDNDTTIPTSAAVKDLVDNSTANTGDITFNGSTIISPSNADLTLDPNGTGNIVLNANTQAGPDAASGLNNTTITGGNNQSVALVGGSTGGTVKVMPGAGNGTGEVGDIYLTPGSSTAQIKVGDGSNQAIISSNSTQDLILRTNDGTTEPKIQLIDGANGNINITPHEGGTGSVTIGNSSTVSTGDLGGGTVNVASITMRDPGGLAGAGRTNFNAIEIPFTPDGSTSNDLYIGLDSNADPYITFNNASTTTGQGAKIKTNTGNLILQSGSQRIELAANTVQIGNNTIVVSGNRMFTDASNEDLEFDANGTGNVSSLAQLNMNSNKIINVTDPASAQDAATKAYVDAQIGTATTLTTDGLTITDNNITGTRSNEDINVTASGTGQIVLNNNTTVDGTMTATQFEGDLNGAILLQARNVSGGTIYKGQAVYVNGLSGDTPTVILADASDPNKMPALGVAQADINNNATGEIVTLGNLYAIDTSASNQIETGITLAVGDVLYISATEPGNITNVAPAGESNQIQNIGKAVRVSPNTNMIYKIHGAGRSAATPALNDGNIFIGNASNQTTTTSLQTQVEAYSINNVVEDTTPQLGGNLDINGNSIVSVSGGNISITPDTTGNIILDGLTFPNADGTADQVLGTNGSGVLSFRDPTAINIDGGVADSVYTSVPTIDGGTA